MAGEPAGAESEQNCETSPAEVMSLEGCTAERLTFGVDSGAALTVIGKDAAAEYPRVHGTHETNDGLPRKSSGGLGTERLGFEGTTGRSFTSVTVASVAKNLLSVGSFLKTAHEVVFSRVARVTSGI